jgi:hypothetical protein
MLAFLGKPRVIHDPGHHRSLLLHGRQDLLAHVIEQCLVAPGSLGHQMVQRLALSLHATWIESCRHRLDAFPFAGLQQTLAIVLQRRVPIFVPRGARQAVHISREAFLLWAWRAERRDPTKQFYTGIFL